MVIDSNENGIKPGARHFDERRMLLVGRSGTVAGTGHRPSYSGFASSPFRTPHTTACDRLATPIFR